MTTPGPAKALVDMLRPPPQGYAPQTGLRAFCTSVNTVTGENTVVDGFTTYVNLAWLLPPAQMTTGPVLLMLTPGNPVVLGRLYIPTPA
jgi:hypothetical protein